jgi:hypothetical protein
MPQRLRCRCDAKSADIAKVDITAIAERLNPNKLCVCNEAREIRPTGSPAILDDLATPRLGRKPPLSAFECSAISPDAFC